jgi:hypothetical protein
MGIPGDHTRIELTVRQKRAQHAARQIVRGTDYRAMVVSFVEFPEWSEWQQIMDIVPVELPSERKETNTERWLLDTCAPALARAVYLSPRIDLYERFKEAFGIALEQLLNGTKTIH